MEEMKHTSRDELCGGILQLNCYIFKANSCEIFAQKVLACLIFISASIKQLLLCMAWPGNKDSL